MERGEVKFGGMPTFAWMGPEPAFAVVIPDQYRGEAVRVEANADPMLAIDQSSSLPEPQDGEYAYEI